MHPLTLTPTPSTTPYTQKLKTGAVAITAALATIAIIGGVLGVLALNGVDLGGLNSLAMTVGETYIYGGLAAGISLLLIDVVLLKLIGTNKQNLTKEQWTQLQEWKNLPLCSRMYRKRDFKLQNLETVYAIRINKDGTIETHFFKTEDDRDNVQKGFFDFDEFEKKILWELNGHPAKAHMPPDSYWSFKDPIEVKIYGSEDKVFLYTVYCNANDSYHTFLSERVAQEYIESIGGWNTDAITPLSQAIIALINELKTSNTLALSSQCWNGEIKIEHYSHYVLIWNEDGNYKYETFNVLPELKEFRSQKKLESVKSIFQSPGWYVPSKNVRIGAYEDEAKELKNNTYIYRDGDQTYCFLYKEDGVGKVEYFTTVNCREKYSKNKRNYLNATRNGDRW